MRKKGEESRRDQRYETTQRKYEVDVSRFILFGRISQANEGREPRDAYIRSATVNVVDIPCRTQNKKQQKEAEDLYKNPTEETHIAAAKIQAIQRGKADRERVQELKDQTKAQTKIAAVQRGRKARLEVEEKKEQTEAVKKIQAVQRGRQARQELEDQTKAAGKIAALHRGNVARKQVDNMQAEKDKYVPMDQKEEIGAFLLHIWNKYDADNSGGIDSERTFIKQIVQKYIPQDNSDEDLFNTEDVDDNSDA